MDAALANIDVVVVKYFTLVIPVAAAHGTSEIQLIV